MIDISLTGADAENFDGWMQFGMLPESHRAVDAMVKRIAIGAVGRGFDSRTGQIVNVANGSPPLQRFCVTQVLHAAQMLPATLYTLLRNSASIIRNC